MPPGSATHAFFRRTAQFDKAKAAMQQVSDALKQAFASA